MVVAWNTLALQAIRDTKPGPPMAARALAVVHTCIYDAWAAYDAAAVGTRLDGALRRPAAERTPANKDRAISYAAYRALVDLFPARRALFDAQMASLGYDPADTATDATPSGVGNAAAGAVLRFRHGDGANQLGGYADTTGYRPVNTPDSIVDPSRWQPLRVPDGLGGTTVQQYVGPHWGLVTPFALRNGAEFRPAGPATYPPAGYTRQARAILGYSAGLTDERKVIAEYWADGPHSETPPGHWNLIAQFVSRRDGHGRDADVALFFALTNALLDAGIACWDCKRAYDSVRPITAIRYLDAGRPVLAWGGPYRGTRAIDGGDWLPYQPATVVTPPFPEFCSGHSTFSRAPAEILWRFTGGDAYGGAYTALAGSSRVEPAATPAAPVTLAWATFSAAADQAGLSRRYGGIHFVDGDLAGRELGKAVARRAWAKAQGYLRGGA